MYEEETLKFHGLRFYLSPEEWITVDPNAFFAGNTPGPVYKGTFSTQERYEAADAEKWLFLWANIHAARELAEAAKAMRRACEYFASVACQHSAAERRLLALLTSPSRWLRALRGSRREDD